MEFQSHTLVDKNETCDQFDSKLHILNKNM
jgi:hypothetical protein